MESLLHLDLPTLLQSVGYVGLFAIVFIESGFFLFLPGDSLLLAAGVLASQGFFDLTTVIVGCTLSAIAGYAISYWIGLKLGAVIFTKENGVLFNKRYLKETENFYNRFGAWTVVLARFLPFVRTLAPLLAGAGKMPYQSFLLFSVIGGAAWSIIFPLIGYFLGGIPLIEKYLHFITVGIVVISLIPIFLAIRSARK
jgi:membrane-associated protein